MSLIGKKTRDPSQLPTLTYEIPLKLPTNVDDKPQEISFLDLITNDTKFKTDKDSLELVLSSYVKACGKQSLKEILAEQDESMDEKTSLADVIRVLIDYNDQQNANLGVGYNDPEDDDSFIDDSTAAQDIVPRNMKNEREGFYVNEKHQPIQARYVSESSDDDSDDDVESDGSEDDDEDEEDDEDDEDDDDDDSESSKSEKEGEDPTKKNKTNPIELIDKVNGQTGIGSEGDAGFQEAKKRKIEDDTTTALLTAKRKRSVSEAAAPSLLTTIDDKTKAIKTNDEPVKKVKKLSETAGDTSVQTVISSVLPNELELDIKPIIDRVVKLILTDQTMTHTLQKKIERLYDPSISREFLDLAKKLQRHTYANRQLVFDVLAAKTSICAPLLVTRARLLLLNDYEPVMGTLSLNDLKEKLKVEVQQSLETHIQAHNQAVKDWQQKMTENPPKEKNRGPRKNFRFHKNISELIIRCVDRQLETMTMFDLDGLEAFLHNQIVPLWTQTGWMTPKKIITEVIRMEYRPLRDTNPITLPATMITPPLPPSNTSHSPIMNNPPAQQLTPPRTSTASATTAERIKKDSPVVVPSVAKPVPAQSSPRPTPQPSHSSRPSETKPNDMKTSTPSTTSLSTQNKPLEMATRVSSSSSTVKTPSAIRTPAAETIPSQISETLLAKNIPSDIIRTVAKPVIVSPNPATDSATKRHSTPNPAVPIDLTTDLLNQYKKFTQESSSLTNRTQAHPTSSKDPSSLASSSSSSHHRSSSSTSSSSSSVNQPRPSTQSSTKTHSEKSSSGSLLKEALLTANSTTPTQSKTSTSKVCSSPLAVDNMLHKPMQSPKAPSTAPSTPKPQQVAANPNSSQRVSSSTKISSSPAASSSSHHHHHHHHHNRADQQQSKSHSTSTSSNSTSTSSHRPSSTTSTTTTAPSSSSSPAPSPSARRSTPMGSATPFNSTHESQSARNLSSQVPIPPALSQSLPWDSAAFQLAAAALGNPQLLNSSVFDSNLFNSLFTATPNLISSHNSSSSSSSSLPRHTQSQNSSNHRRN